MKYESGRRVPVEIDPVRRRMLVSFVVAFAGTALARESRADEPATPAAQSAGTVDDWRSVLESMFPHERVAGALYAVPAGALVGAAEKDSAARALLADGWRRLNAAAGGAWSAADPAARTRALATIEHTPLFVMLRQTTVFTFYNHPDVWAAFGYDGDAWRFGGWLGKGVDSIDWLPDPPAVGG